LSEECVRSEHVRAGGRFKRAGRNVLVREPHPKCVRSNLDLVDEELHREDAAAEGRIKVKGYLTLGRSELGGVRDLTSTEEDCCHAEGYEADQGYTDRSILSTQLAAA